MSGGGNGQTLSQETKEYVRVRKSDLDSLTTEVMQMKKFLPKVLNKDLKETVRKVKTAQAVVKHHEKEREQLRQQCLHLQSRLDASQRECQKEREEKLLLREQLWQSGAELQQQADFCSALGSATCSLLWSCSSSENAVAQWLADGKLPSFLGVAAQTLESFVDSLDAEVKTQTEDQNSLEHQFVLALAGTVTNIAAVPCGRNFLSSSAHDLLDTLMRLLEQMDSGVFPKLKVLMLMALYNVSISVNGLKHMSENPGLLPLIWTRMNDGDWEVCLHSLRLLQSVLLEKEAVLLFGSSLLEPELLACVTQLSSSNKPSLKQAAQQTLEDLHALQQKLECKRSSL
ncbi:heat shock factor 2-binding protein isoform X2 [Cynoglossus semilaevis]|uniref:heat shock factor 2-binding protein isoform X2 n=1 Tax=Cynoglossus semilaevis TaxID=244447 RepID=UPI0007DCA83B|nr:heat shock factor 2-binding protein isoform X2 [Cynoglossus semilaevis]